jgi:hypothetical protein
MIVRYHLLMLEKPFFSVEIINLKPMYLIGLKLFSHLEIDINGDFILLTLSCYCKKTATPKKNLEAIVNYLGSVREMAYEPSHITTSSASSDHPDNRVDLGITVSYAIVINSYKRPLELVERAIRSGLRQKPPPSQLILIDQNQEKLTLSPELAKNPRLVHQMCLESCVSRARNTLVVPEGVEWIFFCDDDGFAHPDYSDRMQKILAKNRNLKILAGSILRDDTLQPYSLRHAKGGSLAQFYNSKNLMGSNFCVRAETFDQLGRFSDDFGAGGYWGSGEETDFCWKAYFATIPVPMEYFPELIVYHVKPYNNTMRANIKKAFTYGKGKGALVAKWLIFERKLPVFYELIEMLLLPWFHLVRMILKGNAHEAAIPFASLAGRIYGIFAYSTAHFRQARNQANTLGNNQNE